MSKNIVHLDIADRITPVDVGLTVLERYRRQHGKLVRASDRLCEQYGLGRDAFYKGVRVPLPPAAKGELGAPLPGDFSEHGATHAQVMEHWRVLAVDDLLCFTYNFSRPGRAASGWTFTVKSTSGPPRSLSLPVGPDGATCQMFGFSRDLFSKGEKGKGAERGVKQRT